jgi:hypothetical protein
MKKINCTEKILKVLMVTLFPLLFFPEKIISQNPAEDFLITYRKKIVSNGNYNAIEYIDSRTDATDFGFVYSGAENKKTSVISKTSLKAQLKSFVKNSIDSSTAEGELLFQLRKLKFIEKPEPGSQSGICLLRADMYIRQDSTYKRLSRIDTAILVESPDVTKPLFDAASDAITQFILKNLDRNFSNTENFTLSQVVHMDELEKNRIKLYNSKEYVNGVYKNYVSFKNQVPDYKITEANYKDENLLILKVENEKGKKTKLRPNEFYAFVNEGKPFISAEYGCYILEKKDGDFYFKGEGKVPPEQVINYDAENGSTVKGNKNITVQQTALYEIRIDHIDGSLMRIKEIKN